MAGELRIVGGRYARRRIQVPSKADQGAVRPTSDKVREAVFASLGGAVVDARVLDLYAGSGALGLEALSRGASCVEFVEHDRATAATLRANIEALGVSGETHVRVGRAEDVIKTLGLFDVLLCDPPYAQAMEPGLIALLAAALRPGGVLVLERRRGSEPIAWPGFAVQRDKNYGETRVIMLQRSDVDSATTPKNAVARGAAVGKEQAMRTAIYPGSFDPLTNGHIDIIERGLKTFDRVIVAVANNAQKSHLFGIDERMALMQASLRHLDAVEIDTFDGLIVDYAERKGVRTLLRGLRAVSDFEYELQLASMNRKIKPTVETVFMMTNEELFYVSSRLVREVAMYGGDINAFVPPPIASALRQKFSPSGGPVGGIASKPAAETAR